jgi:hypothetical protein
MPVKRADVVVVGGGIGGMTAALAARDLVAFRELWSAALPSAAPVLAGVGGFDELLRNDVVRVDCRRWSDGRLVLLGDAAHAMAPNLGQGANSAMVDAAVLAAELAGGQPLGQALDRYQARREAAVRRVQDRADRLARLWELANPVLRLATDASCGRCPARPARRQGSTRWCSRRTRTRCTTPSGGCRAGGAGRAGIRSVEPDPTAEGSIVSRWAVLPHAAVASWADGGQAVLSVPSSASLGTTSSASCSANSTGCRSGITAISLTPSAAYSPAAATNASTSARTGRTASTVFSMRS